MRVYTSYFYQIRFFKPYMIPLSTAISDPKWYHNFKGKDVSFIDRRGVINGLRIFPLVPAFDGCTTECRGRESCQIKDPEQCKFLSGYRDQLDGICFSDFMTKLESYCGEVAKLINISEEPVAVFIVYETPSNECSERVELHKWFERNGILLEELPYPIDNNFI